ncbi:Short-chain dehydrogenase/reductase SDR [Fusarium oxysporum f. sp. vasinfectum]|nr:Short-chain dehydrogenase/reductase SDR [Fusarium oxysporum f. sp. vasinfectum]
MSYSVKDLFAIVTGSGSDIGQRTRSSTPQRRMLGRCSKQDPDNAYVGQYKTYTINTVGPIRLTQTALDYWQQHAEVQGNLLLVANMGGYMHSMQTPLYFASIAALVSMVKSLSGLERALGFRNAAICPGPAHTPIFEQEYCRDGLQRGDVALEPEHVAELTLKVFKNHSTVTEIL